MAEVSEALRQNLEQQTKLKQFIARIDTALVSASLHARQRGPQAISRRTMCRIVR